MPRVYDASRRPFDLSRFSKCNSPGQKCGRAGSGAFVESFEPTFNDERILPARIGVAPRPTKSSLSQKAIAPARVNVDE